MGGMMFDYLSEGRWWDRGIDLVPGCTPVSPGCAHCWSAEKTHRAAFQHNPKIKARYGGLTDASNHFTGEVRPQWQDIDKIGRARKPQVYTFWNDLFHPGVEEEFVTSVMLRILTRPQHFYIICTKRPERALEYFQSCYPDLILLNGGDHRNILARRLMLMTTAENQELADRRLPFLLQIPGVMHGVSVEPGLGVVDLTNINCPSALQPGWCITGDANKFNALSDDEDHFLDAINHLDLVICGGESGPHARPMHPDIPRKLRDDCVTAGRPFFLKSLGEWVPALSLSGEEGIEFWKIKGKRDNSWGTLDQEGNWFPPWNGRQWDDSSEGECSMYRVGKKAAGRILDGRTWDEVPEVAR